MVTVNTISIPADEAVTAEYDYQPQLTSKLDNLNVPFTQEIINEIVLWKVNRYATIDNETLQLLNKINKTDTELNTDLTREILERLLSKDQKGFRLAMASTILRFKNPRIYQIIDQRAYRFLFGHELKYSITDVQQQITIYLGYLQKLQEVCLEHSVNFETADRVFYTLDKVYNKATKLKGF